MVSDNSPSGPVHSLLMAPHEFRESLPIPVAYLLNELNIG
jgi:hypothetical protein